MLGEEGEGQWGMGGATQPPLLPSPPRECDAVLALGGRLCDLLTHTHTHPGATAQSRGGVGMPPPLLPEPARISLPSLLTSTE